MPVIPMLPILRAAVRNGYAHGAFNVNSIAQVKAVIDVHEYLRSGAVIQGADLANGFMGGCMDFRNSTLDHKRTGSARLAGAVREYGQSARIPVAIHLDHGREFAAIKAAIDSGYTSVMIDASDRDYATNVDLTREVVKYAHPRGVTVEAELGVLAGIEDDVFSATSTYTDPGVVVDFFRRTKIECLAISYGTKHGANKGRNARLRAEIVIAATENLRHAGIEGILVSHGSSIVPTYIVDEINRLGGEITDASGAEIAQLQAVIRHGVAKINIDTDIRLATTRNVREYFAEHPEARTTPSIAGIWEILQSDPSEFDPRVYLVPISEALLSGTVADEHVGDMIGCLERAVFEAVGPLVTTFGSVGSAGRIEPLTLEAMADEYARTGI